MSHPLKNRLTDPQSTQPSSPRKTVDLAPPDQTVAYVVKGFPRNSEAFITNEVRLLEQMGLQIRVFSAFRPTNTNQNKVSQELQSPVSYLPEDPGAIDSEFRTWLCKNLRKYGHSHVLLFWRTPRAYFRTLADALWLSWHCRKRWMALPKKVFYKDFLRAGFIAEQILRAGNVGHLHAHFCHGATTMAMFASSMTGIPFSFTAHAKDIYVNKLNPRDLLQIKMRRAEFVVTCTEANRVHLQQLHPDNVSVNTIYHGVDTQRFAPSSGAISKVPRILSVGRQVEKKGFPFLIEACHSLVNRGCPFFCRIVGEPDEQTEQIHELIDRYGLGDHVSVEGGVTQEKLREFYSEASLFALACHIVNNGDRDGIPNVIAESMSMGLPIVSTRVSGIPELVTHGRDGLLVEPKNSEALADALEDLLVDQLLRERFGRAARAKIRTIFDSQHTTVALYRKFLECLQAPEVARECAQSVNNLATLPGGQQ